MSFTHLASDGVYQDIKSALKGGFFSGKARSWLKILIEGIAKGEINGDDVGAIQVFIEQHWKDHQPTVLHITDDWQPIGVPHDTAWPDWLPESLLITAGTGLRFNGKLIPGIFVTRCQEGRNFPQECIEYVLAREKLHIDDGSIRAEPPKHGCWSINFADPDNPDMRYSSFLRGLHIDALLAAEHSADYVSICRDLNIDLGVDTDEGGKMMYAVHTAVYAAIYHCSQITEPRRVRSRMKIADNKVLRITKFSL